MHKRTASGRHAFWSSGVPRMSSNGGCAEAADDATSNKTSARQRIMISPEFPDQLTVKSKLNDAANIGQMGAVISG